MLVFLTDGRGQRSADCSGIGWGGDEGLLGTHDHNGQSQLPIYQDLGVNYIQLQLRWDRIAPTRLQSE